MKRLNRLQLSISAGAVGCAVLACTPAALAQASPGATTSTPTEFCGSQIPMTPAEQIQQLSPAKNPAELLQLLRKLHDNFLLLDPSFIEDANLLRLFGPGEVRQEPPFGKDDKTTWKTLQPSADNSAGMRPEFRDTRIKDKYTSGRIYIGWFTPPPLYGADLVEEFLVPDVKGYDPMGPGQPLNMHAMESASRRPLATHPKGYFQYELVNETARCRSALFVRLHKNGIVWDIHLNQEVKNK